MKLSGYLLVLHSPLPHLLFAIVECIWSNAEEASEFSFGCLELQCQAIPLMASTNLKENQQRKATHLLP